MNGIDGGYIRDLILLRKPSLVIECGTGKTAVSALSIVKSLMETGVGKLISYEIGNITYRKARESLKMNGIEEGKFLKLVNDDFINFFNNIDKIGDPDIVFLDGGDEKLINPQWHVNGKNYGKDSLFSLGISENLTFFKKIEDESNFFTQSDILLHDWDYGRGTFIKKYLEQKKFKGWEVIKVLDNKRFNLCHLKKKIYQKY